VFVCVRFVQSSVVVTVTVYAVLLARTGFDVKHDKDGEVVTETKELEAALTV
jgi:hypothetical protein